jgi:glycosyltransferase involved in cell wall biosynthesis
MTTEAPIRARTPRVSVVIPAKNEAHNIGWVLERLPPAVDEVVLVDGHSSDGTIEAARRVRPDVVVVLDGIGKGAALRAGVAAASGDIVVMLDADGSMDPEELQRFIEAIEDGHDLAKGSRFLPHPGAGTADMTPLRDAGNRALLLLANTLFRTAHTDLCYGYAAFRREAFESLGLTADGFEIEAQLFLRAHRRRLRVAEVASFEFPRRFGNSNLNTFRDGWRVLKTILTERLPERLVRSLPAPPVTVAAAAIVAQLNPAPTLADRLRIPIKPRSSHAWSGRPRLDRATPRLARRRRPEPVKEPR